MQSCPCQQAPQSVESQTQHVVDSLAEAFFPAREAIEASAAADPYQSAQRQSSLDAQLRECVDEHVSIMSGRDLAAIGDEMLRDPQLAPETAASLRSVMRDMDRSTRPLRDILFTSLCDCPQVNLEHFHDISVEHRKRAKENLRVLLDDGSDGQLRNLCDKVRRKGERDPQTRRERLEILHNSDVLELSFDDPHVAIELSEVLASSGRLSSEMSSLLEELSGNARHCCRQLRGLVSEHLYAEIRETVEAHARERLLALSEKASSINRDEIGTWQHDVEQHQELERAKDGNLLPSKESPFQLLALALAEEEDALRDRDKREDEREARATIATKHALMREIQIFLDRNPELVNSIDAIARAQLDFLDPLSVAARIPEFKSALA